MYVASNDVTKSKISRKFLENYFSIFFTLIGGTSFHVDDLEHEELELKMDLNSD
jgi:hypothetical protein